MEFPGLIYLSKSLVLVLFAFFISLASGGSDESGIIQGDSSMLQQHKKES